jgi:hypothetical protein
MFFITHWLIYIYIHICVCESMEERKSSKDSFKWEDNIKMNLTEIASGLDSRGSG